MHDIKKLLSNLDPFHTSSRSSKPRINRPALLKAEVLELRQLMSAVPVVASPVENVPTTIIHESTHVHFTANLGNFTTVAPADNLTVSINWGDGKVTSGQLKSDGIVGVDEINFEVDGTHTYKHPGTYEIHVTVSKPGQMPNNPFIVAEFHDQAIVMHRQRHH